jgi:hypothetical protein
MADDIQWTEAHGFPLAGTYVGPQAVLEGVFMRLGEIGDDFAVVPEQFVADGETVVVLGSYGWKHKSSGEPAVVKMVHVWTMNGGKAVTSTPSRFASSADSPPHWTPLDRPTLGPRSVRVRVGVLRDIRGIASRPPSRVCLLPRHLGRGLRTFPNTR